MARPFIHCSDQAREMNPVVHFTANMTRGQPAFLQTIYVSHVNRKRKKAI